MTASMNVDVHYMLRYMRAVIRVLSTYYRVNVTIHIISRISSHNDALYCLNT